MKSVRQHLADAHTAIAAQHDTEAASDGALAKCFGHMAKAAAVSDAPAYQAVSDEHATLAKSHVASSAYHNNAASECMKAHESDLQKLVPDSITSVPPNDLRFGIRAIPREGQPPLELTKTELDNIHPHFRHLVETDIQ